MAILITGHKGFIGQNMMEAMPGSVGYEWGDGPVSLEGIHHVIHLGAISSTACRDWDKLKRQNVDFSIELLNACDERNISFQFASSASVYGPEAKTFKETDTPNPSNDYAKSKYLVEQYINSKSWRIPIQVFRYFNVFGKYEEHKDQPSPHTKFRLQKERLGRIEIFEGSENFKRDFIPVERIVEVHKKMLDIRGVDTYNLGTGKAVSFKSIAEEIAEGAPVVEVPFPNISSYQTFTQADTTKLDRTLSSATI